MEKDMRFFFMLSLKEIAMRRVAINIWNDPDVLDSTVDFINMRNYCGKYSKNWRESVENKVKIKLSKLVMPKSLLKQVSLIITPIGLEIQSWKGFHERYFYELVSEVLTQKTSEDYQLQEAGFLSKKYLTDIIDSSAEIGASILAKLRWSAAGTIDYRKTAEELIRCKMVGIEQRYRLACLYCLEDCIPFLWDELPEVFKRLFYNEADTSRLENFNMPYCWPYILKGEQSKMDIYIWRENEDWMSFNQAAFCRSACTRNVAAATYFFQKLTSEERKICLSTIDDFLLMSILTSEFAAEIIPFENSGKVLCYLLSLVDYEQQKEIIKKFNVMLFGCFLAWPWQDIFLKNADLIWDFLPEEDYEVMLHRILFYISYSNYIYPQFFQEFFTNSPISFRKEFVDCECSLGNFFPRFFDMQDSETIEVILRNTNVRDRVRIVSSGPILNLFYDCILEGRTHMVEVCLRESTLSKKDKEGLKEAFRRFLMITDRVQIHESQPVWLKFLQILDEIGEVTQSKRSSEDETQHKAKMLCSV